MPNEKVLNEKKQQVAEISEKIKKAKAFVIADYRGISVEKDTALRKSLREKGVEYQVIKNTLLNFAVKENGIDLGDSLNGPTAIAISYDDILAPAKMLSEHMKDNENYSLKIGYLEGRVIGLDEIKALAEIPSKEILIAKMLGSLQAPIRGLVCALDAIQKQKAEVEA